MHCSALALSLSLLLQAEGVEPPRPPPPLPRSSIAAVLAHRGELGLDAAEVGQLEERDAALQKLAAELRQRSGAPPAPAHGRDREARTVDRPTGAEGGTPPPMGPASAARPEGLGAGGGHRGSGRGGRRPDGEGSATKSPAERATALQTQLDDADTAAWLAAEPLLRESKREAARAVAEKYREALADQRELGKARR